MYIQVNLDTLETTDAFQQLGRTVAFNNIKWMTQYGNLINVQRRWGMLAKLLMNMGSKVRAWEIMYKVVVQTVLIYGSGSWVVTDVILKLLEVFHHRVA